MSVQEKTQSLIEEVKKELDSVEWELHCLTLKQERLSHMLEMLEDAEADSGYGPDEDDFFAKRGANK